MLPLTIYKTTHDFKILLIKINKSSNISNFYSRTDNDKILIYWNIKSLFIMQFKKKELLDDSLNEMIINIYNWYMIILRKTRKITRNINYKFTIWELWITNKLFLIGHNIWVPNDDFWEAKQIIDIY
jgi:hypothetical protein